MEINLAGRHAGSRRYIQGFTSHHGKECNIVNLEWMLYSVYDVHGEYLT